MRQKTNIVATTACVAVLVASAAGKERQPVYTAFDVPGAISTNGQGINARGDIVGGYVDKTGNHGYLLRHGTVTTIDYPGAAYTDARGINGRGEIVGAYKRLGEPGVNIHGYLRTRHGDFIPIDFPGHTNAIPQRITSDGLILGCRHDTDTMGTMRGVTINSRDPSETSEIDAFASMNNGATRDGNLIVGLFTDMDTGRGRGYLLYGETLIPFDAPGATLTAAWDVNERGAVAGVYRDAANKFHGFLWERLRFSSIDFPGASATRAFGINAHGAVVGTYIDAANRTHAFVVDGERNDDDE